MLDKLVLAEKRYEEIEKLTGSAEIAADMPRFRDLMKEYKNLTPIIEKFREYKQADSNFQDAISMVQDTTEDREMRQLAEEEEQIWKAEMERLEGELKVLLLPKDANEEKNAVVEIRAGAGGEEAALFASVLYRMYTMYADRAGFKVELISVNETGLGGFKEVTFSVSGEGAYAKFRFESGVHRVQRVPETEASGRIHTSTVTVAVLPEAEDIEVEILPSDLKIETIKSSGAGGQHVNKTESAIRLIHKPSGIVIECQDERSQYKNRDKAMKLLRTQLYDIKSREQSDMIASERKSQVGSGDRSERIRTYNYPQGRVSDHRIGLTVYTLENFLNGDISGMIDALATADAAEKLKGSN